MCGDGFASLEGLHPPERITKAAVNPVTSLHDEHMLSAPVPRSVLANKRTGIGSEGVFLSELRATRTGDT
jgi:hypothetical protein